MYLNMNEAVGGSQAGFHSSCGDESKYIRAIYDTLDIRSGFIAILVTLDLSAVFSTAAIDWCISDCYLQLLSGIVLQWFLLYLEDRIQEVPADRQISSLR